jgi:hypothetical protein
MSVIKWSLLFKDSISGTVETAKVIGLPERLNVHAQSKTEALPAAREKLPRL